MYLIEGSNREIESINRESKRLISVILSDVPVETEGLSIPGKGDFSLLAGERKVVYFLRSGHIRYIRDGQTLYIYDDGDLIGLEKIYGSEYSEYAPQGGLLLDRYDVETLFRAIKGNPVKFEAWNRYLAHQINVHGLLVTSLMKADVDYEPLVRSYGPGEVIIEEKSTGTEVYTMLSGTAEVFVMGMKVGEIQTDEIFGAIAALTGLPRTATVKAVTPCTTVVVDRESFTRLLETRPNTIFKLAEDMTRVIVSTNERLVALSKGEGVSLDGVSRPPRAMKSLQKSLDRTA